jgi:hypothetical protein
MGSMTYEIANRIMDAINQRDGLSRTSFRLWMDGDGNISTTQSNISVPGARMIYQGQGWESDDMIEDADWVFREIDIDPPVYEVDEAMLGSEWSDGTDGLRIFCRILQRCLDREGEDVEVKAITDTFNGAKNQGYHVMDITWGLAEDIYHMFVEVRRIQDMPVDQAITEAEDLVVQELTPEMVRHYIEAGAWSADGIIEMVDAGLEPEDAREQVQYAGQTQTIAYWICNRDLNAYEVIEKMKDKES